LKRDRISFVISHRPIIPLELTNRICHWTRMDQS